MEEITEKILKDNINKRPDDCHKGTFGRVLVIAGSDKCTGAAFFCGLGAVRCGAGLVEIMSTEEVISAARVLLPEAIFSVLPACGGRMKLSEKVLSESLKKADSVVIGPGMGVSKSTEKILKYVVENFSGNIIIDADGINLISRNINIMRVKKGNVLLTPHPAEAGRILGISADEINMSREKSAVLIAKKAEAAVLLKGHGTIVADMGGETYINTSGSPALARGGSGDLLSGMIGAFAATREIGLSAKMAAYLHGKAGEEAGKRYSEHSVRITEIADMIPDLFLSVEN